MDFKLVGHIPTPNCDTPQLSPRVMAIRDRPDGDGEDLHFGC